MIVIPMAGLSARFFEAGYDKPKYMLEAHGKTLFEHSVESFERYFKNRPFLFVVRDVYDTPAFVTESAEKLGIADFRVVILDQPTRGQAETVFLALRQASIEDGPITIFNIDTFRPGFRFPPKEEIGDGFLEVFKGTGDNWSFARPVDDRSRQVAETAEKRPISDLCSTGLYHFSSANDFKRGFEHYRNLPKEQWAKGELYVAPIYNQLINSGKTIFYSLIPHDAVIFCGTPQEYQEFVDGSSSQGL